VLDLKRGSKSSDQCFSGIISSGVVKSTTPGQKLACMGSKFKLKHGEWHRSHRSWWEKYPAWVVIALLLTAFLLWIAWRKISP